MTNKSSDNDLEQHLDNLWAEKETAPRSIRTNVYQRIDQPTDFLEKWLVWLFQQLWRPVAAACIPLVLGVSIGVAAADQAHQTEIMEEIDLSSYMLLTEFGEDDYEIF